MDWTKVTNAVATVAPWIAGTLGSPVAGVAVKALVDVFGLSEQQSTPSDVVAALSGASPAQLQALRDAEIQHAEFMKGLGYKHIEQLAALTVEDRDSARKREAATRDNTNKWLAGLAVVLFLTIFGFVAWGTPPAEAMRNGFWLLAGAVMTILKDVYGYYFGSSHGSRLKDNKTE